MPPRNSENSRWFEEHVKPHEPMLRGWLRSRFASEASSVLDDGDGIPETIAYHQELELLTEAIQSLPDRCRQIFTRRKVYGLSQAEIAEQMRLSENTVSAQLTIGVKKCMAFMLP